MAQKVQTLFIDDLDGSPADDTVRFALDDTGYEIDLNTEHAKAPRDALARYISVARGVTGNAKPSARVARKMSACSQNTTEIREWAKAQGIDVKDRGRIPAELVARFNVATRNYHQADRLFASLRPRSWCRMVSCAFGCFMSHLVWPFVFG